MYWQLRLAAADRLFRRDTLESVNRALSLAPESVEYLDRLAELDDMHTPEIRARELAIQPRLARVLVDLATRAEFEGDLDRAEHLLLRAAEVDRTWLPRWVLTNFYFRRHAETQFWAWARQSASFGYGDLDPLFDLCMQITDDTWRVQRELGIETPFVTRAYVNYLRSHGRLKDAGAVSRRLVRTGAPSNDLTLLLSVVDQLIDNGEASGASEIWTDLATSGWLHRGRIDPLRPVTNPELASPFMGRAFDWRTRSEDGVSIIPGPGGRGVTVTFSGAQSGNCVVLEQILPLEAGVLYRLVYQADSETPVRGLSWVIVSSGPANQGGAVTILLEPADSGGKGTTFTTPAGAALVRLQLVYARPIGSANFDGSVRLLRVAIEPVKEAHPRSSMTMN